MRARALGCLSYLSARGANQCGKPASAAKIVAQNKEELYWISTLAFDNRGNVLVTSNKLAASFKQSDGLYKDQHFDDPQEFYAKAAEATASGPGIAENSAKQSCVIEGIEQFPSVVKPKYYPDLLAHYEYKKYQADHMYHADPKMYKEQTEEWPHFKAPQQTPVKVWQDKKPHQKADNHL